MATNSAGYSRTPLYRKLGIREGTKICALHAPAHYRELLAGMPDDVRMVKSGAEMVHIFLKSRAALEKELPEQMKTIPKNGTIWVSWPKKSSGLPTDLTENVIRDTALALGLVDVKVCAVDEVWSALRLVYRLADR